MQCDKKCAIKLHEINRASVWWICTKRRSGSFFPFYIIRRRVVVGQQEADRSPVHTDRKVWLRWPLPPWEALGGSLSCVELFPSAGMTAGGPRCLLRCPSLKPGLDLQAEVQQPKGEDCNHPGRPAEDSWCTESTVYLIQKQWSLRFFSDHKKVIS